ncbi:MAG: mechanosensitive ion channel family protein [Hyphomicrobiales bacterium]|nr:mechanosensitive ion channel family protein [Hyphomicrobiales bacterium]
MAQTEAPAEEPAAADAPEAAAPEAPEKAAEEAAREVPPELPEPILNLDIDTAELHLRLIPLTKDELAAVAEQWLVIVKGKTEEVMEAQVSISKSDTAVEEAVRDRLTELVTERKALFDKFDAVVNGWELKGGDEAAIADLRAYRNSIIIEETRTADYKTLIAQAVTWLTDADGGLSLAWDIAIAVVAFAVLLLIARLVRGGVRRRIDRVPNLSKLLQVFLVTAIYWVVLAVGIMLVLSALGVDVTPLFAVVGGASFIVAFALQDSLSNLASGLMIMVNRPFDEGDYVDIGGVAGTVKAVSIVATRVNTPDNQVIVIPNSQVWGNVITNVTASDTRRVDLVFGIGYEDDIAKAIAVIDEAVKAHPLTLEEPEPTIVVGALADSSVNILCRPWVKTEDYWTVFWDLTGDIKVRFDAVGISIPFPQQDVHVHAVGDAPPTTTYLAPPPDRDADKYPGRATIARDEPGHDEEER